MKVENAPESTWITVPSWMLVRAPMRMEFMSPRSRQWNQMPVSDPITTSPITAAVGAMKASSAICGVTPFREKTVPHGQRSGILHFPHTLVDAHHQTDILHGSA